MVAVADDPAVPGGELPLESGGFWLSVVSSVPDTLLLVDGNGRILYLNHPPAGVTRERVLESSVFDHVAPELRVELVQSLRQIFTGAEPCARVLSAGHPDGSVRWYAVHTAAVRHERRVPAAAIVARDVTDRVHVEASLHECEARYRTVMEHAPEAVVVLDVDRGQFVDVNRNACELFGVPRERLLSADPVALSPPLQPDGRPSEIVAGERIGEALEGGAPVFEWIHRTPAGIDLRCEIRLVRLPAAGRRLVRGSVTDLTRQRQLEEHLYQSQKLEALGQLASGIAHDFNNILSVISSSADVLVEGVDIPPEYEADVSALRAATRRGSGLTRQLLSFARRQQVHLERLDLNVVVEEAAAMVRRLLWPAHVLTLSPDPAGAPVRGDRTQLGQVLMNLLLNARDAMPAGGSVTITTSTLESAEGRVVRLRVEDTGVGMDEDTRQRIFEPFFTTKEPGKGTGLGLSTVLMIVKQSGGRVEVASSPGQGSTFDVLLPRADAA